MPDAITKCCPTPHHAGNFAELLNALFVWLRQCCIKLGVYTPAMALSAALRGALCPMPSHCAVLHHIMQKTLLSS